MPPLYDYACEHCLFTQELLVPSEHANADRVCPHCHDRMRLVWMKPPASGKPRHQTAAVMSDGSVVPGHFGKEARRDPLKRKKR